MLFLCDACPHAFFRMMSGHLTALPDWLTGVFSGGMTGQNGFLAPAGISFLRLLLWDIFWMFIMDESRQKPGPEFF